jgi:cell division septum initiation protein DivIVA
VVTQQQLNKLVEEINNSYAKLFQRLADLEGRVNEKEERLKTGASGSKRVQQTKANPKPSN